jgi:hypothetical protein
MEWYQYLDPEFAGRLENIRRRHRVVAVCTQCQYRSVVILNNLIQQINKLNTHLCFSCSAKRGASVGMRKREQTMLRKYGKTSAQQIPQFREKRKKTFKNKRLEKETLKRAEKVKTIIIEALLKRGQK